LYLIPALRNKNTHLTPPIPVIAVQLATLLADCAIDQDGYRKLPPSLQPHIVVNTITLDVTAQVMRDGLNKQQANLSPVNQVTGKIIGLMLCWLYTLGKQRIHGGASWYSQVNRRQLLNGVNLLGKRVPIINEVMMGNFQALWGEANYSPIS